MKDGPIHYELWHEGVENPPPRSRLYSLEPIGIGTPEVESLSGYINRLAQAHCVRASTLLKNEVIPHIAKNGPFDQNQGAKPARSLPRGNRERLARLICGTGLTAEKWVEVLGILTGRSDLRFLTLLDWRYVLHNRHLFSPTIRWCPACFDAWLSAGNTVYNPLLWKLNPITSCLLHQRKLRASCLHCHQPQNAFTGLSRPGFCSRCGGWLGSDDEGDLLPEERLNEDEWQWQNWIVKNLGQLFQAAPKLDRPPPMETVARSVTYYLSQLSDGDLAKLGKALGRRPDKFRRWSEGKRARMQTDLLLKFCFHCEISLAQFLTETLPVLSPLPSVTSQKPIVQEAIKARRRPKDVNREELRQAMESALEHEFPPLSLRAVAKRMKVASRTLLYYEPELCRQIVARGAAHRDQNNERIRSALKEALRQSPPPTLKDAAKRNSFATSVAWNHYPDLCAEIVAKHRSHETEVWENVRRELERSLREENLLPTIKALAARFGCSVQSLRVYFSDLCHEIATRRAEQQQACFLSRREQLLSEIREAALKLHAQGIFPSVNRVSEILPRPRGIGGNKDIVAELRKIRKELGWKQ
jgi:AcrR family transcriptional regulator